ncbi:MAG: amidohydrolase family protein [Saprospiraceae bacterium]|nr:amidohydrolase family protein [Saprospiraceae bacterium]
MMIKYIYIFSLLLIANSIAGQQVTKSTYGDVLLKNATVHTVTDGTLNNTDVFIKDGLIADIGNNLSAGRNVTTVDCSGKHIYPGFIDSDTRLALSEVSAVSLTNDFNEIGDLIPHMQALTAVNPNATAIPVTRVNGVTSVIVAPTGGIFPGTASLIDLIGYTPEQMDAGFRGVIMNFPSSARRGRRDSRSDEDIKKAQDKATKKIDEVWDELALYHKIDSAATGNSKAHIKYQPEMDALLPVYRGEFPLMINVSKDKDIEAAINWVTKKGVKAIFIGVSEGYRVADKIAEAGIPVIAGPVLSVPGRAEARYDVAYANPGIMAKAGVKVAIRTGDSENVRNLPFNAGFAATYGMGKEEALKAITINPAEMFGVADKYGSISKGKVANLFVSTGDPFEMKTRLTHLFIKGWNVPIESRHTLLYNEFLKRSPGLED